MTDTVNESFAWPINSSGEIVVSAGAGDDTVVAYLPSNMVPIGATGGVALKLPTAVAGLTEGAWTAVTLTNSWVASTGFAAPAYRIIGTTAQLNLVVEAGTGSIATLPAEARPDATISVAVFGEDLAGDKMFRLHIGPSGVVSLENVIPDGDQFVYASFSYPLNLPETLV